MLLFSHATAEKPADNILKEYDRTIRSKSVALDSIKTELENGRRKLAQLAEKEGSFLEKLELLEKNMATAHEYMEKLDGRIASVTGHVEALHDSLEDATVALHKRQLKMEARLRAMYMTGNPGLIHIVLSSATLADMLYRIKYFQELKNYDQDLLASIDSTRDVIRAHTATMEEQRQQLVALKSVKEAEHATLKEEQKSHRDMLKTVRSEKEAYEQMVKELEQAQQELALLLGQLQKKREKAKIDIERARKVEFAKRKGKLPWPAEGNVVKGFGKIVHPVYKTITVSTGIDIAAKKGQKVFCVAPGRIDYVGWMRGYGKFVIVNHYDGYITIYAHLDNILVAADENVEYGAQLGVVGETGSISGPKLHFQLRKQTEAMDPMEWLEPRE